jgi:hypothetical protein
MDASRFDQLTKSLSTGSTRRGFVRLIAAFPLAGSLAGLLGAEESVAKRPVDRVLDRAKRKQEKRHHRNDNNSDNNDDNDNSKDEGNGNNEKKCKPASLAETCQDRCGPVKDNCGKTVDCGPCGTCRADTSDCNCPGPERSCLTNPRRGERVPSCVCDLDFCRFDGPLSGKPTRCCSCGVE